MNLKLCKERSASKRTVEYVGKSLPGFPEASTTVFLLLVVVRGDIFERHLYENVDETASVIPATLSRISSMKISTQHQVYGSELDYHYLLKESLVKRTHHTTYIVLVYWNSLLPAYEEVHWRVLSCSNI